MALIGFGVRSGTWVVDERKTWNVWSASFCAF